MSFNRERVFLFASFRGNGEDGLHLAYSMDALQWTPLKQDSTFLRPEVGGKLMRDPCILPGPDGTFHMVWTTGWWDPGIGLAHSRDLVNWSKQELLPVMAHVPRVCNAWAPEIVYDPVGKHFMIFWASTVKGLFLETSSPHSDLTPDGTPCNHRIYCTTTHDFTTYSPARLLYDPGFNCIDATIIPVDGRRLMFIKDETKWPVARKDIRMAWADTPTGPWSAASAPISPSWVEGPTCLKVGEWWHLYFDEYTRSKYGAMRTRNLKQWEDISDDISFPAGVRHGTIFSVSQNVLISAND